MSSLHKGVTVLLIDRGVLVRVCQDKMIAQPG
jgi:hypothetical protein